MYDRSSDFVPASSVGSNQAHSENPPDRQNKDPSVQIDHRQMHPTKSRSSAMEGRVTDRFQHHIIIYALGFTITEFLQNASCSYSIKRKTADHRVCHPLPPYSSDFFTFQF